MTSIANVLLVEDDATARQMLVAILSDMGYAVTSAANGDEALSYIYSEEVCDVVLTDIVMPGMSGLEFAQRTREARPGLPLVLVTGQPDAEQMAVEAGAIALPKPITRERLARILGDVLDA
jgi:CheY-like chemotaxis protein